MTAEGQGVYCIGELRRGRLLPVSIELLTPGRRLAAAKGEKLTLVLPAGPEAAAAAESARALGADRVVLLEGASLSAFVDEAHAGALRAFFAEEPPRVVLFGATVYGRSVSARLAVALEGALLTDAVALDSDGEGRLVSTRSAYGGSALLKTAARRGPALVTVRPMAFARPEPGAGTAELVRVAAAPSCARAEFVSFAEEEAGELDIASSDRIVSGGRGLGGPEGFKPLRELAHALNAAVGASRAAVDAGWIPYKHQIGLTGRSVRPRLYLAVGISGQIQHMAGMKSSEVIVAVNTDPECPMMKLATLAVQEDWSKLVPALTAAVLKAKG
ncbi:MAG: electron transfer flavoprotein subunit alpha/FixB family protein [Elusimicrobiota bacterium]|jgi:electron transfer flavoprotein alpha subunit